jgi:signal transduction histidine kinase
VRLSKPDRRLRLGRWPTLVLVTVLALTAGGFVLAQRWVERSEEDALEESAASAAAVVGSFGRQVEAILYAGSVIVDATGGDRATFERAIADRIEGTAITNINLLDRVGDRYEPVARAGRTASLLLSTLTPADDRRLGQIAESGGEVRIVKVAQLPQGRVVGFATSAGEESRFVIYAESHIPAIDKLVLFRLPKGVEFATYLEPPSPSTLIQATTETLPIPEPTVTEELRLGNERAVLVIGGGRDLVGGLTTATPWIVLVGGIVLAIVLTLVIELVRRRQQAETEQRALSEQNRRLRELDRLKDELVATVSHELRTPLTSILGYLELAREQPGGLSDEQRGFLEVVERNAKRLLGVVSDLLLVATIDAGRLELEIDDVDLREVATECVEAARPQAEHGGVSLTLRAEDVEPLRGDRARIAQLLDNLVSNAIKFTASGGRVELRVRHAGRTALVEVEDTGMGIPEAEHGRLFERFFRASSAAGSAIQGTGLGLTIAKAIVEAHDGTISVESVEGSGTTFRVELPLSVPAPLEPRLLVS